MGSTERRYNKYSRKPVRPIVTVAQQPAAYNKEKHTPAKFETFVENSTTNRNGRTATSSLQQRVTPPTKFETFFKNQYNQM